MNFEYGNVNNIEDFHGASMLRKFIEWDGNARQLLSQLGIKYIVLPICGTTIYYRADDGPASILLWSWLCYHNRRRIMPVGRTEFTNFLQNLVKKRETIAILPQPIAEEIIEQYSATEELLEFIDSNNASK